jgi:hypothetical protein
MYRRLHSKLGTAGLVVAVIALIAAVAGTAFAAGGLTKKQEKQVIKIAKKYAGKPGAKGDPGSPGAQGPKGDPGPKGEQGPKGDEGKQGPEGEQGIPGPTETTLPPGKTETGVWSLHGEGEQEYLVNISYQLRVVPRPELQGHAEEDPEHCPGSAENPEAEPGWFCLYRAAPYQNVFRNGQEYQADSTSGFIFGFESEEKANVAFARGTWAVTEPCPIDPETEEEEEC